jgi:putative MFS transporter
MIALTLAGLLLVLRLELAGSGSPVLPVALLIVGTNGLIAIVLPYTAESFPLRVRGRATGWVAACTKGGGLIAQGLTISGVILSMGRSSLLVMLPTALSLGLVAWFGRETRGRDLRDLDADNGQLGYAEV